MIDLHCHILPAIDDGSPDMETTMKMLDMAARDGIGHIVASPHFRHGEEPSFAQILENLRIVQEEAARRGITVKLYSGADVRLTYELFESLEREDLPSINNSRYFLLELPDLIPPHLDDFIFEAKIKGYVPIITHPERNYSLLSAFDKADALRESGALFQLTAMSITGDFGKQIRKFSLHLLKKGYVDFVASDAHSTDRRIPVLSRAYSEVTNILGADEAQKMFIDNPRAVLENRELQ
ncbi:MAG: CpsB/CapC family capsule biosynthesis tyrosine phosphatase [Nitrospirota bacterium]|nr:CpsB/CapC family capsule biosynthesis tyrosine phosphatase [Nitrospirota bacterium]